ncbi:SNF2 family N-terminal domain-containing protein [Cercophora samala]|uniref:SNF2 family N-terminal domain-containing protein n=1 Tax=Cercophora samala TaxID=330535 RepID=A0AA39ZF74_9PEZI|nr:SNF2 family N-terminal domain-containing protein [Cercophora samala]
MSSTKRPYPFENEQQENAHAFNWQPHDWWQSDQFHVTSPSPVQHGSAEPLINGPAGGNVHLHTSQQHADESSELRHTIHTHSDLEADVAIGSTPHTADEAYICFGSIPDLKAQLRTMPLIRPNDATLTPSQCFKILEHGAFYALDFHGIRFAVLKKKICESFKALPRDMEISLQAFISREEWGKMINRWEEENMSAVVNFDLNIYGLREHAVDVGRALSKEQLFLQQPCFGLDGYTYYNPHYLHPEEILGKEVSETPIPLHNNQSHDTHLTASDEPSKVMEDEIHPNNDTAEINTILNSLSYYSILAKSLADRSIIRTVLLDHQAKALDFILRRETGELPPEMSLWENCPEDDSDLDDSSYRHIITGGRSKEPRDVKGGIIADDMGLGKTLVVLSTIAGSMSRANAFLSAARNEAPGSATSVASRSTLVICPSSLLIDSWIDEIRKHTYPGYITWHKHHGQGREDGRSRKQLMESDVVLTTYATVVAELRKGQAVLRCIDWFRIVLDEAHEIRNSSTKQHQATAELRAQHRWCLTGTPIQNSVDDLGALVSFLRVPSVENPATFRKFIANISTSNSHTRFKNLRMLLGSICLRRTREILGLPDPEPKQRDVKLTASEREEYKSIEQRCRQEIDRAVSGHGRGKLNSTVLESLLRLRLFCNNGTARKEPGTVSPRHGMDMDEVLSYLQQNNEADCSYCFRQVYSINEAPDTDGGLLIPECLHLVCRACIPQYHAAGGRCPLHPVGQVQNSLPFGYPNHTAHHMPTQYPSKLLAFLEDISMQLSQKSIVFSSWKKTLGLIGELLTSHGIPFYCIQGSLSLGERIRILQAFRSSAGANILLMTLGTGAVGLNLAVASRIYLMEPQWNPSVELQAIGRALRLGQTEQVAIVRYIVKHTIEDSNVLSRQEAKLQLASGGFGKRRRGIREKELESLLGYFRAQERE